MALRFDPKTGRVIVGDLTPSIKGNLITMENYMALTLSQLVDSIEETNRILRHIETHLSSGSGEELNKEETE